jgi:redox-sensitive bicupin YhaK (pirin superfamily)
MPAVTVENTLVLPRLERLGTDSGVSRPVLQVVTSHQQSEGAGFRIWRPFPGELPLEAADPFLLLDQLGPTVNGPEQTVGAPWHPHRGIETVSYILDGEIAHHDSNGGGGVIREGDTQWMTAGAGILHDELPTEAFYRRGGLTHAVQLWVNLPADLKFSHPRYQAITCETAAPSSASSPVTSADSAAPA